MSENQSKNKERKNLGIEGSVKLPNSDYFLVPGSLWSKYKTRIHGEPECDESEFEMLVDSKGKLVLDEKQEPQEVFRRRNWNNPKDREYFKNEGVKVHKSFTSLCESNGEAGSLYIGGDGKIYDPSGDVWVENKYHETVRELGGVFVNDTYIHLWKKRKGLLFMDGSYGSGKTTFVITHLLLICLSSKKGEFVCFYGRQEKEMASQLHKNIVEEIKRNNWEDLFSFSEADNGSKNIHCKHNDGIFQIFGCDELGKIKGWNNPTHILVDEVNQISFKSFGMLFSRLRRPGVDTLFIGCFNACDVIPVDSDDDGSWLWRYIFKSEKGTKEEETQKRIFKSVGITVHHSDYLDNYCQNNFSYWYKLVVQAGFDINIANRFANGDWGTKLNAQLYYNRFDIAKHVFPAEKICYNKALPLIVCFDENTQPYQPVLIAQKHGNEYWFIDEILGYNPNNNVTGVTKMFIRKYGGYWDIDGEKGCGLDHRAGVRICGDATSKKEDSKLEKGENYFTIIQSALKQFKPEVWVQDANPSNKSRGEFINLIFYQQIFGLSIKISEEGCPTLIKDMQNVMQDVKNEKKSGHKDKSTKIVNGVRQVQPFGHLGDCLDYLMCENSMSEYLTFKNGDMTIDAVGGTRNVRNYYEKKSDGRLDREESKDVKWNKKSRGDTKYSEVDDSEDQIEEDVEDFIPVKRQSKNSW